MTEQELVQAMMDGGRAGAAQELQAYFVRQNRRISELESANADLAQMAADANQKTQSYWEEAEKLRALLPTAPPLAPEPADPHSEGPAETN